MTSDFAPEVAI